MFKCPRKVRNIKQPTRYISSVLPSVNPVPYPVPMPVSASARVFGTFDDPGSRTTKLKRRLMTTKDDLGRLTSFFFDQSVFFLTCLVSWTVEVSVGPLKKTCTPVRAKQIS